MTGDELIQKYGIGDTIPTRWPRCGTESDEISTDYTIATRLRHANAKLVAQRNDPIHDIALLIKDRDQFRRRYLVAAGTAIFLTCFATGRFLVWVAQ